LETAKFFANFLSTFLYDSVFAAVYQQLRSDLHGGEGKITQHCGRDCVVSHFKNGVGYPRMKPRGGFVLGVDLCWPSFAMATRRRLRGGKPITSIFEAEFAQPFQRSPRTGSGLPLEGASLRLIAGLLIPKGLRPKFLATSS
jgi:hypothetical protein